MPDSDSPSGWSTISVNPIVPPTNDQWAQDRGLLVARIRELESAAAGANVVGREALAEFTDAAIGDWEFDMHTGGHGPSSGPLADCLTNALLSPSGPLRDEAVVKAEGLQEAADARYVDEIQGAYISAPTWLRARAAALLATTTTTPVAAIGSDVQGERVSVSIDGQRITLRQFGEPITADRALGSQFDEGRVLYDLIDASERRSLASDELIKDGRDYVTARKAATS